MNTFLIITSTVLCAATASLLVRSCFVADRFAYHTADVAANRDAGYRLYFSRGVAGLEYEFYAFTEAAGIEMFLHDLPIFQKEEAGFSHGTSTPFDLNPDDQSLRAKLGFGWHTYEYPPRKLTRLHPTTMPVGQMANHGATVLFPLWLSTFIFSVPPLRWLELAIRRRRRDPRLCPHCGYDLRATPNRCPECGRTPTKDLSTTG